MAEKYKKITSYPPNGCVPECREAEDRGRKQDGRDLSTARYPIYQPPPLGQDMTQGQFLSGV